MTRQQWSILAVLSLAVVVVFCVLSTIVVRDLSAEISLLLAMARATLTPASTPTPTSVPTFTPTPLTTGPSTSTADEAIALVRDFRYDSTQQETVGSLISTLLVASQQMGNTVQVEGWHAADQGGNLWLVTFSFWENEKPSSYEFWADTTASTVKGYNDLGETLLTFLSQDLRPPSGTPTPVSVAASVGDTVRDDFSHWDYMVTEQPRLDQAIVGLGQEVTSTVGYLIIPLRLTNISDETQEIESGYYYRFSVRDEDSRLATHLSWEGYGQPTRLYCEAENLPHFAQNPHQVAPGERVDTALAFELLPTAKGQLILDIVVYEGNSPHTFSINLDLEARPVR
ncbi:MAG: hypothetical protein E3J21_07920 [Anaerolineales bacterium]|nr:MAG: hypothetical protein E3J21_07920 [Anaerolineales bacterium]